MTKLNENYDKLAGGYLFPEIAKRTQKFREENPGVKILKLGIGDTTQPLTPEIAAGLDKALLDLTRRETYAGYGPEQGVAELRNAIASYYASLGAEVHPEDVFVSDGAKPDSANIQGIFSLDAIVAVEDPSYPVYVDSNVIAGRTGRFNPESEQYEGIVYMPCTEDNGFFPEIPSQDVDLIYLCRPNNPTGAAATRTQLKEFVDYAIEHGAVIIFDAAYAAYISDPKLPRSIFEIEGAERCAIEINSLSKDAGFTGVRLGWTIVPKTLVCEGSAEGEAHALWNRRQSTMFNGASRISQGGAIAAMSPEGRQECSKLAAYYMRNAEIIRSVLKKKGIKHFGGVHSPYVWMKTPDEMRSWDLFDKLLEEAHVVGTPGSGFGPSGEGYFRLSAFGSRRDINDAMRSILHDLNL